MPNEKLLPPGVSIVSASDAQMMKVRVESYPTREQAEAIVEANKPFYQGEIREIRPVDAPGGWYYEIWKPATRMQIDFLHLAKRGDLIRFLIRFSPGNIGTEFVTAVVMGKSNGLIRSKVYSRPEKTAFHGVEYGDELVINENQVITHEQSTAAVVKDMEVFLTGNKPEVIPINAEDAKLRAATQHLPPLKPEAGKQYWTRNGTLVTVWTFRTQEAVLCSACGRQLLGTYIQNEMCPALRTYHDWVKRQQSVWLGGTQDGAAIEWTPEGAHAGGIKDLDIVKDPRMNEVIA
jgi:hypothetical protein